MKRFPGLAHRMEEVGNKGKVLFVNDSKATNADAAERALMSFADIFWIAGGKLGPAASRRSHPSSTASPRPTSSARRRRISPRRWRIGCRT